MSDMNTPPIGRAATGDLIPGRGVERARPPVETGTSNAPDRSEVVRSADRVEISELARRLSNTEPQARNEKIAEARAKIADGTLETDANLRSAIDTMLDDLFADPGLDR